MGKGTAKLRVGDSYIPLFRGELRDRFTLIESRRGCAKTRAALTHIVGRALTLPKSRWFLARQTRTRLTETVLTTLEEQVLPLYGIRPPRGGRENRWDYKLPSGSVLVPLALEEPGRTQSAEYSGGMIDEATEPGVDIGDILAMAGTLRHAATDYFQVLVLCNPGAPNHPLNLIAQDAPDSLRMFTDRPGYDRCRAFNRTPAPDGKWKRIIATPYDNPGYFDVNRWEWTKLGQTYYDGLKHLTGHMKARWLHGLWVAAEGGVFPEFGDANIVEPFTPPAEWPWAVLLDPGYAHNCGIVWVCVSPFGVLYVMDERLQAGQSISQHAAYLLERAKGRNVRWYLSDPHHADNSTAQSPESINAQFRKHGLKFDVWPRMTEKGAKESAVERTRERVVAGTLKVFSTCPETIGQFRSWRYKKNAKGELLAGDDQYEDKNNDLMDPLIGAVAANLDKLAFSKVEVWK